MNPLSEYVINNDNLSLVNFNSRIMHPLPHVEEIDLPIYVQCNDKCSYTLEGINHSYYYN